MTRFVVVTPLLLVIVLLAGAASVASAQSPGCATGSAVTDAANNPGLVADCEALLASDERDTLAGTGTLDWSASTPIADWDGVTVGRRGGCHTTARYSLVPSGPGVDWFDTSRAGQSRQPGNPGALQQPVDRDDTPGVGQPRQPGNPEPLQQPVDRGDTVIARQSDEPGTLAALRQPVDRGDTIIDTLEHLYLGYNRLSGPIPSLGNLTNLRELELVDRVSELGNLANLEILNLYS